MIKKGALIIGYPGEVGDEEYCDGVNVDLREYEKFFLSEKGGAWNHDEITVLNSPRRSEVIDVVNELDEMDYSIVVFSGHGFFDMKNDVTVMQLNDDQEMCNEFDLRNTKHRTIILDCCRVPNDDVLLEEWMPPIKLAESMSLSPNIRKDIRRKYESNIEYAISYRHSGIITTYACSVGETAGDYSRRGGVYSYNLIRAAKRCESYISDIKFRSIVDVHNDAVLAVTRIDSEQNPDILKPRSGPYYPFAVSYSAMNLKKRYDF